MRKIIIMVIALAAAGCLQAQVYIQTTLPTVGLIQKNQLWNLVLINGTTATMEGKLTLALRDRQNGLELLSANTSRFTLPKGSMPVTVNNLNPIQYNYVGMGANSSLNGLLPAGAYTACYSFIRVLDGKEDQLMEECVAFDIEPLSPPLLIFPADSSELEQPPAQFTWTPPTPAGMMNQLRYEILITEIKPGQQPAEALQQNMSFYNTASLVNNFITYPAAMPAFEKEKWYSWQVVARDEKSYAGKSEVWVFKVKKELGANPVVNGAPYLKMKPDVADQGIAPNGILKLSFFNRTADTQVRIVIHDLSGSLTGGRPPVFTIKAVPGENQAELNLKSKINLSEDHTYKAEITYSTGETASVLFRVKYFEAQEGINHQ